MEGLELDPPQGLCENIRDLLISSYMIEPYSASLYHIPDKAVPDINMLGSIVEHGMLGQPNPTLVITEDNGRI